MDTLNRHRKNHEKEGGVVSDALEGAKETLSDFSENVKEQGEHLLTSAQKRGQEWLEDVQERGEDAWQDAKKWVQRNPVSAVGCAFLVGAGLYALISRRDD